MLCSWVFWVFFLFVCFVCLFLVIVVVRLVMFCLAVLLVFHFCFSPSLCLLAFNLFVLRMSVG